MASSPPVPPPEKEVEESEDEWQDEEYCPVTPHGFPAGLDHPQRSDDDILPYLLNDDAFHVSRINPLLPSFYAVRTIFGKRDVAVERRRASTIANLVWESFRAVPEMWLNVVTLLRPNPPPPIDSLPPYLPQFCHYAASLPINTNTRVNEVIRHWKEHALGWAVLPDMVVNQTGLQLEVLLGNLLSAGLGQETSPCNECWLTATDTKLRYYSGRAPPLTVGLNCYIDERLDSLAQSCLKFALTALPAYPPRNTSLSPIPTSVSEIKDIGASDVDTTTVLFSTAGTGKSRWLLDDISQRWGMYIMAPSDRPQSSGDNNPNLLQFESGSSSKDSFSMWKTAAMMNPAMSEDLFSGSLPDYSSSSALSLLINRLTLLRNYIIGWSERACPRNWMLLQITCGDFDAFDLVWRLIRHFRFADLASLSAFSEMKVQGISPIWCFDEVQQSFEDYHGQDLLQSMWSEVLLSGSKSILSGTSLRLPDVKNLGKQISQEEMPRRGLALIFPAHLRLIEDTAGFERLFQLHISSILEERKAFRASHVAGENLPSIARAERTDLKLHWPKELDAVVEKLANIFSGNNIRLVELSKHISDLSTQFFGRHRWSTIFSEELLKEFVSEHSKPHQGKRFVCVEDAAQRAALQVQTALRRQISRIEDREWTEQLYWLAIRADVYSQSSVLEEETARLVSEGFAILRDESSIFGTTQTEVYSQSREDDDEMDVDPTDPLAAPMGQPRRMIRQWLSEPLAVEAVMAHLREHDDDLYGRLTEKILHATAVDNVDQGSPGKIAEYVLAAKLDYFLRPSKDPISLSRRSYFGRILSEARSFDVVNDKWVLAGNMDDYYLQESKGKRVLDEKSLEIEEWLERMALNLPPTFLFPKKEGGPDLMFVISHRGIRKLCVLQFKTGFHERQPANVESALETLLKDSWNHSNLFDGDIIFIHVVTYSQLFINDDEFGRIVKKCTAGLKPLPGSHRRYFCYIDKRNSAAVWGQSVFTFFEKIKDDGTAKDKEGRPGKRQQKS
ncbi:hypothetical protein H2200_000598 [Cladophialophora chaetospira]|uniref:Uncharacterized protein n=1 Tax=Cladophialophora chaetospira TaxID=386627 RepID=A0AA38XNR9_9EURO|nr:hypothetical protein H2200_000598 [Cladophialophora chaetospira]